MAHQRADILLYTTPDGAIRIDVVYQDETVWLTQLRMSELFEIQVPAISKYLKNIFESGELDPAPVVSRMENTAADGKTYKTRFYNLDAVIAVGYRVNSRAATQFRIWATRTLRDFIIKGSVLDTERLKNGPRFGTDYFEELLEKIREIRASERRFYQKITDIYAQCSSDYDSGSELTRTFYATVQNELHWAIHGRTAAELIAERSNPEKPHMGLTTWGGGPSAKILKRDVALAKNYLLPAGTRRAEPCGRHVPRLRRVAGEAAPPHADAGLGREARRVSPVQRARSPLGCRSRLN